MELPLPVIEAADGTRLATASGGDGDSAVVFVHAIGLCKEVWNPVIAAMRTEPLAWLSMDLRGHGDSGTDNCSYQWDLLGRDVLRVLDGYSFGRSSNGGQSGIVGVGHSAGGAAVARAAVESPGTFRHIILIEPIIFPTPTQRLENPMSAVARKRRSMFESREAARSRFSAGPFADWTPQSLDAYLDGGFRETDAGFELKCSPEVEAECFVEGSNHDTWDIVRDIDIPVTIVAADGSTTHREPYLGALVDRFAGAELVVFEDATHHMPMETPDRVAALIDDVMSLPSV